MNDFRQGLPPAPPPARGPIPGSPGRQSYAGYGLEPPRSTERQHPLQSLEDCIEAAKKVWGETISIAEVAPWQDVPFRQRTYCIPSRAVLNVPAAVNAAANAGGLTLAAANSLIVPCPVLDPVLATNPPALFFALTPNRSHMIRVVSWGISVVNAAPEALAVSLRGGSEGGLPSAPSPEVTGPQVVDHAQVNLLLTENKPLQIYVTNRTTLTVFPTALLIEFGICYYEWPVPKYEDSKESTILRSGFGEECR